MKSNKIAILLVVTTLVLAMLACVSTPSAPSASNFYLANDRAGQNKTTTFTSSDDIFAIFDLTSIPVGTAFQGRWYALDVPGEDPTKPFLTSDYTNKSDANDTIYFQAMNSSGWPSGSYKVEIYMSDTKVGEMRFSVK